MTRGYYAVLAKVSLSYPPLKGRLVTCYSPVRHFTQVLLPFLVRLACVRHAASVDSEPGSNSRLKPDVSPPLTEVSVVRLASAHLDSDLAGKEGARRCSYLVRMIKPNSITSHDWHVQPICQRSLRAVRLSGAPWIEAQAFAGVSSNLLRSPTSAYENRPWRFCANLLNLSKFDLHVNVDFPLNLLRRGLLKLGVKLAI